jgi:exodeoxyribonuclease V alpha subunit
MEDSFEDTGLFSEMDIQFARFITGISRQPDQAVSLAAALVSRATMEGHVCLDLKSVAGEPLDQDGVPENHFVGPELTDWLKSLQKTDVVGRPGDETPLILDDQHRLYLFRYWEYERILVEKILAWAEKDPDGIDDAVLKKGLNQLFTTENGSGLD